MIIFREEMGKLVMTNDLFVTLVYSMGELEYDVHIYIYIYIMLFIKCVGLGTLYLR